MAFFRNELQLSMWKVGSWIFLALSQAVFVLGVIELLGLTFKTKEANGYFSLEIEAVMAGLAPVFCILAFLFALAFDILFVIKFYQMWKKQVALDKADREKKK